MSETAGQISTWRTKMDDVRKPLKSRHLLLSAALVVTAPGAALALGPAPDMGQQLREAAPTADHILLAADKKGRRRGGNARSSSAVDIDVLSVGAGLGVAVGGDGGNANGGNA